MAGSFHILRDSLFAEHALKKGAGGGGSCQTKGPTVGPVWIHWAPHGITSQKTFFTVTAEKTSDLTHWVWQVQCRGWAARGVEGHSNSETVISRETNQLKGETGDTDSSWLMYRGNMQRCRGCRHGASEGQVSCTDRFKH
jgi:hypothetical protein